MKQRIKSITFKNFKFFYGTTESIDSNQIVLDRKNLLLYGENGSGKSSIYWGIYTILQSCLKQSDEDIYKYFKSEQSQNLRNRFAQNSEDSGIIIHFENSRQIPNIRQISNRLINTKDDDFIRKTLNSSDFINYKYLSKTYDFRNSEDIDLFPLFQKELFMFIDLGEEYYNHEGQLSGKSFASDWWNFIFDASNHLPYNGNIVSVSSDEYIRFKRTTIPKFIELLKRFLNRITEAANFYLKERFKLPILIKFDLETIECDYNKHISTRAKDGILHIPKIPLRIIFDHEKINSSNTTIERPHIFLNEAKLTAVALSIRLAILDEKLNADSAKVLVIDDLLISLDMSNRDIVLDMLLEKATDFQLLIFTHDRAFYNIAKLRIQNNDKWKENWIFKELYHKENESNIPIPVFLNPESYLSSAYKYIKTFDYPACANYLRKESERVLCSLLPYNETIFLSDTEGSKPLPLEQLIMNFKKLCIQIGLDHTPYKKLIEYKNLLLNPLSHDNIKSPIYRQELLSILDILEKLNKLKRITLGSVDSGSNVMKIKVSSSAGEEWLYHLYLKENFFAIKDVSNNTFFANNPLTFFKERYANEIKEVLNIETSLQKGYKNICHKLGLIENKPILDDILTLPCGQTISSYLA